MDKNKILNQTQYQDHKIYLPVGTIIFIFLFIVFFVFKDSILRSSTKKVSAKVVLQSLNEQKNK